MSSSGWDRRNPNRIFVSLPARPKWHCPMAIGKDGGCSGILLFLVAKIYMPVVSRRNFLKQNPLHLLRPFWLSFRRPSTFSPTFSAKQANNDQTIKQDFLLHNLDFFFFGMNFDQEMWEGCKVFFFSLFESHPSIFCLFPQSSGTFLIHVVGWPHLFGAFAHFPLAGLLNSSTTVLCVCLFRRSLLNKLRRNMAGRPCVTSGNECRPIYKDLRLTVPTDWIFISISFFFKPLSSFSQETMATVTRSLFLKHFSYILPPRRDFHLAIELKTSQRQPRVSC